MLKRALSNLRPGDVIAPLAHLGIVETVELLPSRTTDLDLRTARVRFMGGMELIGPAAEQLDVFPEDPDETDEEAD